MKDAFHKGTSDEEKVCISCLAAMLFYFVQSDLYFSLLISILDASLSNNQDAVFVQTVHVDGVGIVMNISHATSSSWLGYLHDPSYIDINQRHQHATAS